MANIDETSTGYNWETEGVYQIEKNDPVEGGKDGISNLQGKQLTHRTRDLHTRLIALKAQADGLIDQVQGGSVGSDYDTLLKLQNKLQAVESAINGDNGDALIETLQEALGFINDHKSEIESLVGTYVKKASIADNLTTTEKSYVLSAYQGTVLNGLIGNLTAIVDGKETPDGVQQKVDAALRLAKQHADDQIANLVDSSPAALDTLKELADALGNDPNFATTVLNKLGEKVSKVEGKDLSTNDFTNEDKQFLDGLKCYDYVVDSDEKLAGLINNSNAVNVLIKSGEWRYNGSIELHLNTKRIYGEAGNVLGVQGFGYADIRSLDRDYSIEGVNIKTMGAPINASYRGFVNMKNLIRCSAGVIGSFSVAFDGCANLVQCSGFAPAATYRGCTRLYQCEGDSNNKSFDGCYDMVQCYGNASINSCCGVFQCRATGFVTSYFSTTNDSVYACTETLNGGWNYIIRV